LQNFIAEKDKVDQTLETYKETEKSNKEKLLQ
jgi:hypothetical protein